MIMHGCIGLPSGIGAATRPSLPFRLLAVHVAAAGSPGIPPPDRSSRRPRKQLRQRTSELVQEPVPAGPLGQAPMQSEMEELAAMFERMSDEERQQAFEEADDVDGALLSERLQGMDDGQLRAHVDGTLSKWVNPSFWDATLTQPLALDALRERLDPAQSALLGKLLVSDETTGDIGKGLNTNSRSRLGR